MDTHEHDPNFPPGAWGRMNDFLLNDALFEAPEKHEREIAEAKIEASLLTSNSPYSEVRAVVEPHDDPDLPCGTIRVYVIGLAFVILVAFINQLFSVRQPSIFIGSAVVQLLAYPVGKAAERVLPDVGVTIFGVRHSLNPGPFNKKEHMLISIMANVSNTPPSSRYISMYYRDLSRASNLTIISLHTMVGQILRPALCQLFWISDPAGALYQLYGLWSGWAMPKVPGLPVLLYLAEIIGHYCIEQLPPQR